MHKNYKLCCISLAVSLSLALALPAFVQGQSGTSPFDSSRTPSTEGTNIQASERVVQVMEDEASTVADQALNQRIREVLSGDVTLAVVAQKIHLATDNGEVTLHGFVTTDKQKADIVAKVQQVSGVKKIDNQLRTATN
jgi:hypothetical protein